MSIETVKIKSPDTESGFVIVNKADFKEGVHELFEGKPKKAEKTEKTDGAALDACTKKADVVEYAKKAVPGFDVPAGTVAEMKAAVKTEEDKRAAEAAPKE